MTHEDLQEIRDWIVPRKKRELATGRHEIAVEHIEALLAEIDLLYLWLEMTDSSFRYGEWVTWSQFNGIACHGVVLAETTWNGEPVVLVRYAYDPKADPPRRSYTLVEKDRVEKCEPEKGYVLMDCLR